MPPPPPFGRSPSPLRVGGYKGADPHHAWLVAWLADARFSKRDFYEEFRRDNSDHPAVDQSSRYDRPSLASSCTNSRRLAGTGSH